MCTPHDLLREPHAVHGIDFLEPIHNVKEVETKSRRGIAAAELLSSYLEKQAGEPADTPHKPQSVPVKGWWSLSGSNR